MTASVTLRVYTGTNAGTQSAAQAAIRLLPTDTASTTPAAIAKGANSFEKWIRLSLDAAAGTTLTNFWLQRDGDLPTGVTVKFGVTDTAATPTAATSTVATTTMADARRYIFDTTEYDTTGDKTRWVVVQGQVAADATSGAIEQQVFTAGYAES